MTKKNERTSRRASIATEFEFSDSDGRDAWY